MKRVHRTAVTSAGLVLTLVLQFALPWSRAYAQVDSKQASVTQKRLQREDTGTPAVGVKSFPRLSPTKQAEIESIAQAVADTVVLQDDGTVGVNQEKFARLGKAQRKQVTGAVSSINEGRIGVAITGEDGSVRSYGNSQVLGETLPRDGAMKDSPWTPMAQTGDQVQALVSTWWDGYGYAIYFDPWFTSKLKSFDSVAIGTAIGLMVTMVCGTGVGCIAVGVVIAFFWDQVWQWLDRRYFADSLIVHIPKWNWVYIQPFKKGAWFDGRWFRTWLWT